MPELELQRYVKDHLEARGYIVQQTGITRRKAQCPRCGQWAFPHTWSGNNPGLQDLFISRQEWGNHWVSVEMKTLAGLKQDGTPKSGDIKPEQQTLVDLGVSDIARTLNDVLSVIKRNSPRPPICRELDVDDLF